MPLFREDSVPFWSGTLLLAALLPSVVAAQDRPTTILPGFSVITGFSGTRATAPTLPPGVSPAERITIHLEGASLRLIDATAMGGPPSAQVVTVPKPLTIPAAEIGQVFSIALDDAVPPNIYAAATSSYGLPIIGSDADGDGLPDRIRRGTPNAQFMPGLFGPPAAGGGPGSVWRIDGITGRVRLFTDVRSNGLSNAGPALGGIAFDRSSQHMFVADRETGLIHRFNLQGIEIASFDHGAQALPAIGLPPIPGNLSKRLDITNAEFNSENPETWNYAPPARRVFGLGVHGGRLYYAVAAGLRIWSISIDRDGSFGTDARVEYAVADRPVPRTEISKIIFDDGGHMLLAERGPPTGAFDLQALTAQNSGRVIRLEPQRPGTDGSHFLWKPLGDYAIGFPLVHQNGDGGIAIGYGYDQAGLINIGACGGTLWTTGSQLRVSSDPAIAQQLAPGGPFPIDGLQANSLSLLRPQNTPPFGSYFLDFDDRIDVAGTPGRMGDVIVWRVCPGGSLVIAQALTPWFFDLGFEDIGCPPGTVRSRLQCIPRPCPPEEFYRGGRCVKPECEPTRVNEMCCPKGTRWNPRTKTCEQPERGKPDLEIAKKVIRCAPQGGPCSFVIRVTNTGDTAYTGAILVGDFLNSGNGLSLTGPAGWTCGSVPIPGNLVGQLPPNGQTVGCINPNESLEPGQSVDFSANATVLPALRAPWQNCAVVVVDPTRDSNFGNNKSCVRGDEGDKPKPETGPNLTVEKIAGSCTPRGDQFICEFLIRVRNTGSAHYTGEVVVADSSITGQISRAGTGSEWTCTTSSTNRSATCRRPGGIAAGESQEFRVVTTEDGGTIRVRNCAGLGDSIRRGDMGSSGLTRLATNRTSSDLLFRLAQNRIIGLPSSSGPTGPDTPLSCAEVDLPTPVTERPRPDPLCAAGLIPTRTGCCSPESIAAGTCGGTVVACSPPAQLINGICCSQSQIAAGACGGRTGSCPSPSQMINGVCCSPRDIAAGTCGTNRVGTCQPPNRLMNDVCCSPREISAGTCGKTVGSCPGGAIPVRGHCPSTEKPKCQTGEWLQQGQCTRVGTCPDGSKPKGGQCRRPRREKSPDRPKCAGRIDTRGNCVTGPSKPRPPKPATPGDTRRIINPPSRGLPPPPNTRKTIMPVNPGGAKPIQGR